MSDTNTKGVFDIKKSWFLPVEPCVFTIQDTQKNTTEICFGEYNREQSRQQQATEKVLEYMKRNHSREITRQNLKYDFEGELPLSAIKRALEELENNGHIEGIGNTQNRKFKLIKDVPPQN